MDSVINGMNGIRRRDHQAPGSVIESQRANCPAAGRASSSQLVGGCQGEEGHGEAVLVPVMRETRFAIGMTSIAFSGRYFLTSILSAGFKYSGDTTCAVKPGGGTNVAKRSLPCTQRVVTCGRKRAPPGCGHNACESPNFQRSANPGSPPGRWGNAH